MIPISTFQIDMATNPNTVGKQVTVQICNSRAKKIPPQNPINFSPPPSIHPSIYVPGWLCSVTSSLTGVAPWLPICGINGVSSLLSDLSAWHCLPGVPLCVKAPPSVCHAIQRNPQSCFAELLHSNICPPPVCERVTVQYTRKPVIWGGGCSCLPGSSLHRVNTLCLSETHKVNTMRSGYKKGTQGQAQRQHSLALM